MRFTLAATALFFSFITVDGRRTFLRSTDQLTDKDRYFGLPRGLSYQQAYRAQLEREIYEQQQAKLKAQQEQAASAAMASTMQEIQALSACRAQPTNNCVTVPLQGISCGGRACKYNNFLGFICEARSGDSTLTKC